MTIESWPKARADGVTISSMSPEVWGTFAVDDHCRDNAFVREVLLFDRLVLPFPSTREERERWRHPHGQANPETWNPDRLDKLVSRLGSQHAAGYNGAQLAFTAPWSEAKWQYESSKTQAARVISELDARFSTRCILSMDDHVPNIVEAVAAFRSEEAWRKQERPSEERTGDMNAAHALLLFARPILTPPGEETADFAVLCAAIELAQDIEYRRARAAYYQWMRDTIAALTDNGKGKLGDVVLNEAAVKLVREQLRELLNEERSAVRRHERHEAWKVAEYTFTAVAMVASAGLALANPLAGLGVGATVLGFGGWLSGKKAQPEPSSKVLSGASVFSKAMKAGFGVELPVE